ncbi:MAG: SH3 domain-containing protein, partial [Planctomycetes bacterium]|nr:SH3 domain-containing protein [Planctomycetota bacterium]
MRDRFLLGLTLGVLASGVGHGEETLPYRLAVVGDGVAVRSGPETESYVTGYLVDGSSIEVYQRREGGWLGIRPPAGSFSWVRSDQLADTGQPNVARILHDDTVCRVGSGVE